MVKGNGNLALEIFLLSLKVEWHDDQNDVFTDVFEKNDKFEFLTLNLKKKKPIFLFQTVVHFT